MDIIYSLFKNIRYHRLNDVLRYRVGYRTLYIVYLSTQSIIGDKACDVLHYRVGYRTLYTAI